MFKSRIFLDAFILAARDAVAAGEYEKLSEYGNVQAGQISTWKALYTWMDETFGQSGAEFSVFFRRSSGDDGMQIIGAFYKDTKYLYFSITGHKRKEGFVVVNMSFQSDFDKIIKHF